MSRTVLAAVLCGLLVWTSRSVGDVLVLTNETPAGIVRDPVPADVVVVATVLRHRPAKQTVVPGEKVAACRTLPELAQLLRASGTLEVLCHARRDVACLPSARADFLATETRPAFSLGDNGGTPTNQTFGVDLHVDVRMLVPATASTPPLIAMSWEGGWSGSVSLLARWEAMAVRGFNLARAVPGVAYERMEEDEDGFVNTGGGSDLGGLFKRKKKDKQPPQKETKPGTVAAPAAGREPSYVAETAVETVPMSGEWIGPAGQLLVRRTALAAGDNPGDLYLVLQSRGVD